MKLNLVKKISASLLRQPLFRILLIMSFTSFAEKGLQNMAAYFIVQSIDFQYIAYSSFIIPKVSHRIMSLTDLMPL